MATAPRSTDPVGASILETAAPVISRQEAKALHVSPVSSPVLYNFIVRVLVYADFMQAAAVAADAAAIATAAPAQATDGTQEEEPYYWEEGGDTSAPIPKVLSHNVHWLGIQLFHGMCLHTEDCSCKALPAELCRAGVEYVGEIFAEFFGMTASRYEWAIEAHRQQQVCTPAVAHVHIVATNLIRVYAGGG
jgi:hypothetical protein